MSTNRRLVVFFMTIFLPHYPSFSRASLQAPSSRLLKFRLFGVKSSAPPSVEVSTSPLAPTSPAADLKTVEKSTSYSSSDPSWCPAAAVAVEGRNDTTCNLCCNRVLLPLPQLGWLEEESYLFAWLCRRGEGELPLLTTTMPGPLL